MQLSLDGLIHLDSYCSHQLVSICISMTSWLDCQQTVTRVHYCFGREIGLVCVPTLHHRHISILPVTACILLHELLLTLLSPNALNMMVKR